MQVRGKQGSSSVACILHPASCILHSAARQPARVGSPPTRWDWLIGLSSISSGRKHEMVRQTTWLAWLGEFGNRISPKFGSPSKGFSASRPTRTPPEQPSLLLTIPYSTYFTSQSGLLAARPAKRPRQPLLTPDHLPSMPTGHPPASICLSYLSARPPRPRLHLSAGLSQACAVSDSIQMSNTINPD